MKQETNPRRGRNRNSGKRNPNQNSRSRNYDSGGSDAKVRGSSQQILDKYLALARDASLAGDRITAEGFHQYAEHYYRLLNPEPGSEGRQGGNQQNHKPRYENNKNQPAQTPVEPNQQPQNSEQPEVSATPIESVVEVAKEFTPEPAVEVAEVSAPEPVVANEEVVEEKPRRRGRPRKAEAAEPVA